MFFHANLYPKFRGRKASVRTVSALLLVHINSMANLQPGDDLQVMPIKDEITPEDNLDDDTETKAAHTKKRRNRKKKKPGNLIITNILTSLTCSFKS